MRKFKKDLTQKRNMGPRGPNKFVVDPEGGYIPNPALAEAVQDVLLQHQFGTHQHNQLLTTHHTTPNIPHPNKYNNLTIKIRMISKTLK